MFDEHGVDALSVAVDLPGKRRIEGGLMSVLIYHGMLAIEPEALWSDDSPATASLQVSEQDLIAWARRIDSLGLPGEQASTFSVRTPSSHGPKPEGIPTGKYLESHAGWHGLCFRSMVTYDGWYRSRWLHVPANKCSRAVFAKLEKSCEIEQVSKMIRELRKHYELNAPDQGLSHVEFTDQFGLRTHLRSPQSEAQVSDDVEVIITIGPVQFSEDGERALGIDWPGSEAFIREDSAPLAVREQPTEEPAE